MKYPILCMVGTIHGTSVESKLFETLNKLKIDWLCEGENDFRECKSLKNHKIHLITDTLFVYMVLNDVKSIIANPTIIHDNLYYHELIDRMIELLITISRLTYDSIYNQVVTSLTKIDYNWISMLNILVHNPLNYNIIYDIENKLKMLDIVELLKHVEIFINAIITIIVNNNEFQNNLNFDYINKFIINKGNCQPCEDYIFMNVRDESFCDIIQNHNIQSLTVLTVGIDHLSTLYKKLHKKAKYQIIRFKCETNEDIKKIVNYLLYIIDYNSINEHNRNYRLWLCKKTNKQTNLFK